MFEKDKILVDKSSDLCYNYEEFPIGNKVSRKPFYIGEKMFTDCNSFDFGQQSLLGATLLLEVNKVSVRKQFSPTAKEFQLGNTFAQGQHFSPREILPKIPKTAS